MKITLIQVGKTREKVLADAAAEYRRRLRPYAQVEHVTVADQPEPPGGGAQYVKEQEAARLLRRLPERGLVVALDRQGQALSSEEFAVWLEQQALAGHSHLVFLIGGSHGLAESVLVRSQFTLSLSRLTFPHQLVPVLLFEQVYRAFRINRGEPYHK